jgi:glycosyltransferase involved in cell wall biosynthesis
MRVVGDGSERVALEEWALENAGSTIEFAGWSDDPDAEFGAAAVLLAPAGHEPGGLAVLEAMSAGVPVVAAAAGGHVESIGRIPGMPAFAPGDAVAAAAGLRALREDSLRLDLSQRVRTAAAARITMEQHVERLFDEYEKAGAGR